MPSLLSLSLSLSLSLTLILTTLTPTLCSSLKEKTGDVTWYEPGLGACGETSLKEDAIVAVSPSYFDRHDACSRKLRVTYHGASLDLRVVDRCAGCAVNDLDLSPSAFKHLVGDLGVGRVAAVWEWI
ncbi:hypothetical protein XA68_16532 [Ophiocordyceps unilateralis]|uniref:RlpA-like protein double-psi beta-barrel domain-containing protein n=1 Tax=Ophiocordyceps unilateralis TaxID=268505 RepID=A0A2A9P6D2_OPHUN|nr:hypothetical protein XA68_16532 [Ophiocordyceps unilateralis]